MITELNGIELDTGCDFVWLLSSKLLKSSPADMTAAS